MDMVPVTMVLVSVKLRGRALSARNTRVQMDAQGMAHVCLLKLVRLKEVLRAFHIASVKQISPGLHVK